MYSGSTMGKRKASQQLEPMPRVGRLVIGILAVIFVVLVLVAGKFYLPNWRGNFVFLPVALFIGFLLIAAVLVRMFRKN